MENFKQMQLPAFLYNGIEKVGFKKPTTIQSKVIPLALKANDVIAISQTGTGKTHSFLIPIFSKIDTSNQSIQAVIIAPTRELANQIYKNAKDLAVDCPTLNIVLIAGGDDRKRTIDRLGGIQPHIVIGTPGRINDLFLKENVLRVTTANMLVLDEADMTFEMGFLEDVDQIVDRMKNDVQMLVFSATLAESIEPFVIKYLKNPKIINLTLNKNQLQTIHHYLIPNKGKSKIDVLKRILKGFDPYVCIIFANTRVHAHEIYESLIEEGYKVIEMHGDLEPRERKKAMRRISDLEFKYIVATDIAARGIDIDGVSHIINVDLPFHDLSFYTHRAGRTGRGKYEGFCYSIYTEKDEEVIAKLRQSGIDFLHVDFQKNEWIQLKDYNARAERKNNKKVVSSEISRIVNQKHKVKPGYKKKRKQAINEVIRKEKRELIRSDIKKQKKERARLAQAERSMGESK